jgi:hypothetical protein
MEVGIVGLPGCGKTTLFSALTGTRVDAYTDKAHVGVANIPDPRLPAIAEHITTRKIVPATLRLVDLPGVPPGGEPKKLSALLEQIRQVDAICHVVRAFDDGRGADPARDLAAMDTELVLADLVVAEGAADKAARTARTGEREAKERVATLERIQERLGEGAPLRSGDWSDRDKAILRSYGFITSKPVLLVGNVAEADLPGAAVVAILEKGGGRGLALCAKLEAELAELPEEDRASMLESLGLAEPAIGPLARALHAQLGLTTFYTAGDKEVRAWTIPMGATAPEAAGAIHSDIQRGFIRAECFAFDDLVSLGSEKRIREAGKLRSEGKAYLMQDGDVVHFLFNV